MPKIIQEIEAAGGVLTLNGERILYDVPKDARALVDALRQHRDAVVEVLRRRRESAIRQMSDWIAARCAWPSNPRKVWGSEKSLYRDYLAWCQHRNQTTCSSGQFTSVLNDSFSREGDGWQGLCLADDFAASKPVHRLPLATARVQ